HQDWLEDPLFATADSRLASQPELDRRIGEWARTRTAVDAVSCLQSAKVAGVRVFSPTDLWQDQHTREREVYTWVDHPRIGPRVVLNMPWKLSRTPARIRRSGPLL